MPLAMFKDFCIDANDPNVPGSTRRHLLDAGATLVRHRDDDIGWHVLADPEGNEFCVFGPQ